MGVQRDAVLVYKSFVNSAKEMSDSERLAYYDALFKYGLEGKKTLKLPSKVKSVMEITMPLIDSNNKKYESGSNGGRPKTKNLPITREEFINLDSLPEEYKLYDFPKSWRNERLERIAEKIGG